MYFIIVLGDVTRSYLREKKLATILNTTVGSLIDETDQESIFKDLDVFKKLNDIEKVGPTEKGHVLFALDALIQKIKIKNIAAL